MYEVAKFFFVEKVKVSSVWDTTTKTLYQIKGRGEIHLRILHLCVNS